MPPTNSASNITPEQQEEIKKQIELQKQRCPFCQMVTGQIPVKKVYEDDKVLAVLDINPISKGHVLLMPKEHYPIMPLIPQDLLNHLFRITKHISEACLTKIPCQGTNIFIGNGAIAGQSPTGHSMIHIIPRDEGDEIKNFNLPKIKIIAKEVDEILPSLKNNINIMLRENVMKHPIPGRKPPKVEMPEITEEQLIQTIEANPQLKDILVNKPDQFKQLLQTNKQLQMLFHGKDIDKIIDKLSEAKASDHDQKSSISDIKGKQVEVVEPKLNLDAIAEVMKEKEEKVEEETQEEEEKQTEDTEEQDDDEEKETVEKQEEKEEQDDDEEKETVAKQEEKKDQEQDDDEEEEEDEPKKGVNLDQIADLFS